MEQNADITEMLDLMINPVFFAKDNRITQLNQAAARLFLREGLLLDPLFQSGAEEYRCFSGGMLYVTLSISGQAWGASVVRIGDQDVFTLDQEFECEELRVLALAARELRMPLSNAMLAAQQICSTEENAILSSRLSRGLHQLLRIVGNMSDASGFNIVHQIEQRNVNALFREIVEKAAAAAEDMGITIRYFGPDEALVCPVDAQQLERATLNMISNAMKFTPSGGSIQASLTRSGNALRFSVTDPGGGISEDIQGTLFRRYLRTPSVEDSRFGLGLGMLIIRNAAASHGGAVLIDHPADEGVRVSITISPDRETEAELHTPRLDTDYAGELDHVLLELSELLPPEKY